MSGEVDSAPARRAWGNVKAANALSAPAKDVSRRAKSVSKGAKSGVTAAKRLSTGANALSRSAKGVSSRDNALSKRANDSRTSDKKNCFRAKVAVNDDDGHTARRESFVEVVRLRRHVEVFPSCKFVSGEVMLRRSAAYHATIFPPVKTFVPAPQRTRTRPFPLRLFAILPAPTHAAGGDSCPNLNALARRILIASARV